MKIEYANRYPGDKACRHNHDGFEVVTIVGPGMDGMPEYEYSD